MGELDPASKDDADRQTPTPAQIIRYVEEEKAMASDNPPFELAEKRYPPRSEDIDAKDGVISFD